jgi:hypothetical protein
MDEEMDPVVQSSWSLSSSAPPPQILRIPQSRTNINKQKKKSDDATSMIKGVLRVQPRYSGGSLNEVVNNRRKTLIKRSDHGRSSDHDSSSIDNESMIPEMNTIFPIKGSTMLLQIDIIHRQSPMIPMAGAKAAIVVTAH